jgi:diguanylate cyclase (GGDEF)-like protein
MLHLRALDDLTVDERTRSWAGRIGGAGTAAVLLGTAGWHLGDTRQLSLLLLVPLVGAALAVAVAGLAPWGRLPRRALLAWPLTVLAGLLVMAAAGSRSADVFVGSITLTFLYVGVTQVPRTGYLLVPLAALTWWLARGLPLSQGLVRLSIIVAVWVLVAEVPARLLQRLRRMQVLLTVRAGTDALTGLHNRYTLPAALRALLPGDTVVLLDLDNFKEFNDRHGHQAGDVVLAEFGAFLARTVRSSDMAFRYGGEEFLLLLAGTSAADAQHLVERAAAAWALGTELTFSAGVATATTPGDERVVHQADAALYSAKAAGRATCRVHQLATD